MYLKDFEIRWADLDANRHVANSSYEASEPEIFKNAKIPFGNIYN